MKRKFACMLLSMVLVSAIFLGGCGEKEPEGENTVAVEVEPIPEETAKEESATEEEAPVEEAIEPEVVPEGMYRSEITNMIIDESLKNQRPIAVMVDNESLALPHYGIAEADVVYEMMNSTLNGRITRLMCIVKDWGAIEQMGSIRSTRPTNILLCAEWNAVLCHDGGPFYIDQYLANDYAAHFSGLFSRVNNGKSTEYTEYILKGDLEKAFENSKYTTEYNEYLPGQHYKFSDPSDPTNLAEADGSFDATTIELPFPHNKSKLYYNPDTKTYDYSEYGKEHRDAEDNEIATFKNVILQRCSFSQLDENGYMIFNCIDNAGNKIAYYLTEGKGIQTIWIKNSETDITRYYDAAGNEIVLNTGKTYVALVPDDDWDDMVVK